MDYLQPDFYRFNEDSLKLVYWVAKNYSHLPALLDAGAGCGIIGIELAQKMNIDEIHLLEVQDEFLPFIRKNLEIFSPTTRPFIIHSSFSQYQISRQFDLIVSNPPYYLPGKGMPNKDKRKGICRSFQIDSWKDLLFLFERGLTPKGEALVIIRDDEEILKVIKNELVSSSLSLTMEDIDSSLKLLKFGYKD